MMYELLDEPLAGAESHYGLVSVAQNAQHRWAIGQRKAAFAALQKVIGDSEMATPSLAPSANRPR